MCGIAGKVDHSGSVGVRRDLLEEMCTAIEHRGPDSRGLFIDDNVGLGIQRLRVVDLVTGDQPIYNEDRSIVVVLNGEIYNFAELRSDLRRRGHHFVTQGDTEAVVHLYEEHGPACVGLLHGMFAFALWDRRRRRLLLARDRIGKKPLYYAVRGRELTFASELRALMFGDPDHRDVDPLAVDAFMRLGYVPPPLSIFSGVSKLPPGHTLIFQDGHVQIDRYWRLDYSRKLHVDDPRELHEPIREHLRAATRKRLVADVPLGAFLSGGIDSSAVVGAMAEASPRPVKTFSIGFASARFDELEYARRIAKLFGTEHHEFVVHPDAVAMLPKIVRHYGEPFADASAIPSFYLAQMTRSEVTVALNGDGGDEAFGGYTRYVSNALAARLDVLPGGLRRALASQGRRLDGGDDQSVVSKARRLMTGLAYTPAERYERYLALLDPAERASLYSPEFAASISHRSEESVIGRAWAEASGNDVRDVMLEVDTATYLPGDLITKIDIATMAYGLEARSPLLDHALMQFAASIPANLKIRGREKKWIFRQALRGWIPDEILDRPKQGFSVPIGQWLRHELHDVVRDVLLDPSTAERGYFRPEAVRVMLDRQAAGVDAATKPLWALFMLELWHREVLDDSGAGGALDVPVAALS